MPFLGRHSQEPSEQRLIDITVDFEWFAMLLCEYLLVTQVVSLERIDAKPIEAKLGFSECQAQI